MNKIRPILSIIILVGLIFILTGCTLPQFTVVTSTPTESTTTVSPALEVTPSPINSDYVAPSISSVSQTSISVPDFVSIISEVRPSVVAINTKVTSMSIFGGTYTEEGAGSGWIIDSSGLIVTNNHVVEGANDITVTLEDGRNFSAETVRTDAVSDLAVIKISADNLPQALKVGDSSQLKVGEWVVAIGNSLGQGISATKGIVSALDVSISADEGETLYGLIQTDAAINPGNSGGPLVNMAGEVIGINSIKVAQVGVEGMGYAISSQTAIPIINELVKNGYVTRPWMGVSLYTVDRTAIRQLDLAVDKGVLLTRVVDDGPAAKAGLQQYDVITQYGETSVTTVEELVKEIRSGQIGENVQVTYWRGNSQNTATLTLEAAPPPSSP